MREIAGYPGLVLGDLLDRALAMQKALSPEQAQRGISAWGLSDSSVRTVRPEQLGDALRGYFAINWMREHKCLVTNQTAWGSIEDHVHVEIAELFRSSRMSGALGVIARFGSDDPDPVFFGDHKVAKIWKTMHGYVVFLLEGQRGQYKQLKT